MTRQERDEAYPILVGRGEGEAFDLDLDDDIALSAILGKAVEPIIKFEARQIEPPLVGCSTSDALTHYARAVQVQAPPIGNSRLVIAAWLAFNPAWLPVERTITRGDSSPGAWLKGPEPLARWLERSMQQTWARFAQHRFVVDLTAGVFGLDGLPTDAHANHKIGVGRGYWRGDGIVLDFLAGVAGPYDTTRRRVQPEWVELTVSGNVGAAAVPRAAASSNRRFTGNAAANPVRTQRLAKNASKGEIRDQARALYLDRKVDPPNMEEAPRLITEKLPTASRERIREVLREEEFAAQRRPSGKPLER